MSGTQLLSVIGKFCHCTGNQGVSSHSKTKGPRALSRVAWSRVGGRVASRAKKVSSLKNQEYGMLVTTDWHCKMVSITSFKQISLATKWKSDDIFVHLVCVREQNWYVISWELLLLAGDVCGEAMLTSNSKLPGRISAFCNAKQKNQLKQFRSISGYLRMLTHSPEKERLLTPFYYLKVY